MDEMIDILGEVAQPVVETLQEWCEDTINYVKDHAPQYLRYAVYALKGLHL